MDSQMGAHRMIVYRDRAWCSRSGICANKTCMRNYNDTERERNENGVDLPLDQADFKTEECGYDPV